MNKERAENAVRELLLALGQNIEAEGLKDTPRRVAEMFIGQCQGKPAELDRVFEDHFEGMVIVRDIPFVSCCEHHMVFYSGRAHIAYIPKGKVIGLSKLARLVTQCSAGFTIQEKVTEDIASRIFNEIEGVLGCMVVIEAEHGCMNLRGARATGSSTVTSVVKGVFRDVPAARAEFMGLVSKGGPR